jgi:long-chain acyl-CoA synthetase
MMTGYLNRPEATAQTLDGGWLRTGDVVAVEDGVICLRGRRSEWIVRGGYHIYPSEVEGPALATSGVVGAAAVGIPHPVLGEDVVLCVETRPGANRAQIEMSVRAKLSNEIADFKAPRRIEFVDALPRNALGKVNRSELSRFLLDKSLGLSSGGKSS